MKGMTIIVKAISSWVKVLIFLFGIYIVIFGHLTPGGGFAGGVILASSYVLLMLAFGKEFVEENFTRGEFVCCTVVFTEKGTLSIAASTF